MSKEDKRLFSHPSEADLKKGLSCDDPNCSGQYIKKTRDLKMSGVTIRNSEYWECETCGSFVTAKEEIKRIQAQVQKEKDCTGRLTLRLTPELHRQLIKEAQSNHRSLNNEMVYRLEQSLKDSNHRKSA